jgi:hypothetical protein
VFLCVSSLRRIAAPHRKNSHEDTKTPLNFRVYVFPPADTVAVVMRHSPLKLALAFCAITTAAAASTANTAHAAGVRANALPNKGIFGVKVNGTAQGFYGRADAVLSVSFQEYTTGPLYVTEVTLDMGGSNQLLRLFFSRPISAADAQRHADGAAAAASELSAGNISPSAPTIPSEVADVADRAGRAYVKARAGLVVKTYPTTTHAKTVDFSVSSREELESFYKSFRDLYVGIPVKVDGKFAPASAQTAQQETQNGGQNFTFVNRIGGTLFTID